MNFNKDYPIAILDTNIVMDVPNILDILKGCNIVIPFTLIEELDNHKKENKGARDFVNNFLALSEKTNLSKDGYKLENDCMLYLDIDKNNLHHKDINLDSKKQDIKFIAEAKNLKEKYNDMEVVLISSDKIMKITASIFDVKVKFLEEFITEYLKEEFKLNTFFDLRNSEYFKNNKYNIKSTKIGNEIFEILSENKDIDGLYKLSEIYTSGKGIDMAALLANDDKKLYKFYEIYNYQKVCEKIFNILVENKDIDGLYKLSESYKSAKIDYKIRELENNK